jgi:tetratricopeptide (TPR) repeat protein
VSGERYTWEFRARFRRNAFGWKSQPAIKRIKEAVSEIRRVAKKDPVLAADGAVLLLEKLSPALERIDSSSGAIGSAVGRAIDELVPVIAQAEVDVEMRQSWLERLWQAIQDDEMPYIEALGDRWGELCATPHLASRWADELLPITRHVLLEVAGFGGYFKGTSLCLAALLAACRYEELIALLKPSRKSQMLSYRRYALKALAATGRVEEALDWLESGAGLNDSRYAIARCGEEILLADGQNERAFQTYGLDANMTTTFLATYRTLCKKYPAIDARDVLNHCIEQTPGEEGKWFASARSAGFLDVALRLAKEYRTEPKTLISAARDHVTTHPYFAISVGLVALGNLHAGYSYDEPTPSDVSAVYDIVMRAAEIAGNTTEVKESIRAWVVQDSTEDLVLRDTPAPTG